MGNLLPEDNMCRIDAEAMSRMDSKITSMLLTQESSNTIKPQSSVTTLKKKNEIHNSFERKELEESNEVQRLRNDFENMKIPGFFGKRFEMVDGLIVLTAEKRKMRNLQCSHETMRRSSKRTMQRTA